MKFENIKVGDNVLIKEEISVGWGCLDKLKEVDSLVNASQQETCYA